MTKDSSARASFPVTVYHNSDCGTSRKVLALVEAAGFEPTVIDYRAVGWTRSLLEKLLKDMAAAPRQILRERGTPAAELGLLDPTSTDNDLLDAMVEHPILVNRPIVVTARGTSLCRPSEVVLDLLDRETE